MSDHHDCRCDRPVPVRIVTDDPHRYDNTPDGQARLAFDAWALRVFLVLLVAGNILY